MIYTGFASSVPPRGLYYVVLMQQMAYPNAMASDFQLVKADLLWCINGLCVLWPYYKTAKTPNKNINVNVFVYSLISPSVQQASQFTTLVFELALIKSISSAENSAFAHLATAIAVLTTNLSCSTRYPSLLGGQKRHDMRGLPNTSTHYCNVTGTPVTHPSSNQARRCLPSVMWRVLVTTRPCAIYKECM